LINKKNNNRISYIAKIYSKIVGIAEDAEEMICSYSWDYYL